jgi:hypothetical protein
MLKHLPAGLLTAAILAGCARGIREDVTHTALVPVPATLLTLLLTMNPWAAGAAYALTAATDIVVADGEDARDQQQAQEALPEDVEQWTKRQMLDYIQNGGTAQDREQRTWMEQQLANVVAFVKLCLVVITAVVAAHLYWTWRRRKRGESVYALLEGKQSIDPE